MLDSWMTRASRQLFPPTCLLCGAVGRGMEDLCQGCRNDLPANHPACRHCAIPLETPGICGRCQQRPPGYDMVVAPYLYQSPMDYLITGLKFHGQLVHAPLLGQLLAEGVKARLLPRPQALIAVPMHAQRLRERGFNQALEITRHVSHLLDIPLRRDLIRRHRPTPPQSGLDETARKRNLQAAFDSPGVGKIPYRHVALLDDVMTTGATVESVARHLKDQGVDTVSVWVCARTPRYRERQS